MEEQHLTSKRGRNEMKTHMSLGGLCLLALTIVNAQAAKPPTAVLEIGNRKQLFIDDYMIQSLTDARQVLNTATKAPNNPVIKPDRPWEGAMTPVAKVMYDEDKGVFKMWYSTTGQWKAERGGKLTDYHWTDKGSVREPSRRRLPIRWRLPQVHLQTLLCYFQGWIQLGEAQSGQSGIQRLQIQQHPTQRKPCSNLSGPQREGPG